MSISFHCIWKEDHMNQVQSWIKAAIEVTSMYRLLLRTSCFWWRDSISGQHLIATEWSFWPTISILWHNLGMGVNHCLIDLWVVACSEPFRSQSLSGNIQSGMVSRFVDSVPGINSWSRSREGRKYCGPCHFAWNSEFPPTGSYICISNVVGWLTIPLELTHENSKETALQFMFLHQWNGTEECFYNNF